jgi:ABC-2 type transport system permease protein
MAVTGRQPSTWSFVRLKLRLLRNSFRGQRGRVAVFILGVLFGLFMAVVAGLGLLASGAAPVELGFVVATYAGTAVVLGWALIPLLFFGVDETLDPARFALLPVQRMTLARGMLAAAFVGVPPIVTFIATMGLVLAAGIRFGVGVGLVALVGVVCGLTVGIVASRALTSAFAALLRSRRMRDLAAVIIAVLASSVAPVQWAVTAAVQQGSLDQALRVARVLAWTPLAAPYVLPYDVAAGRWAVAGARLAITIGAIAALLWWWSTTIESAMLGATSGGAAKPLRGAQTGAVGALIPRSLRAITRPGAFGAILARESRFWWRDSRRRASLISILMASAVLPIALNFASRQARTETLSTVGFTFAVTMAGTMGGTLLANQFAFDGNAYAAHLLANVPGRVELRARAAAIAFVAVPVQMLVVLAVTALTGAYGRLPAGLGVLAASFGSAVAASGLLSVLAPYPLPQNTNPFATNSGSGSAKGLFALLAMIATLVISTPVVIAAFWLGSTLAGAMLVLVLGVAYGFGVARLGTYIAGDALERRGPEVLIAVTPRR